MSKCGKCGEEMKEKAKYCKAAATARERKLRWMRKRRAC